MGSPRDGGTTPTETRIRRLELATGITGPGEGPSHADRIARLEELHDVRHRELRDLAGVVLSELEDPSRSALELRVRALEVLQEDEEPVRTLFLQGELVARVAAMLELHPSHVVHPIARRLAHRLSSSHPNLWELERLVTVAETVGRVLEDAERGDSFSHTERVSMAHELRRRLHEELEH